MNNGNLRIGHEFRNTYSSKVTFCFNTAPSKDCRIWDVDSKWTWKNKRLQRMKKNTGELVLLEARFYFLFFVLLQWQTDKRLLYVSEVCTGGFFFGRPLSDFIFCPKTHKESLLPLGFRQGWYEQTSQRVKGRTACMYNLGSLLAGEPRTGEPRMGEPRTGTSRTGTPRTDEPRTGESRTGTPRTTSASLHT